MLATVLLLTSALSVPQASSSLELVCVTNNKRESWTIDGKRLKEWVYLEALKYTGVSGEGRWLAFWSPKRDAPSMSKCPGWGEHWFKNKRGWLFLVEIDKNLKGVVDIPYGASSDPWKTVATYDVTRGRWLGATHYTVTKTGVGDGETCYAVKVTMSANRAIRAVDEQSPGGSEAGSATTKGKTDLFVNLPTGKGHRIVVQTREYHWKALKGVHLEPLPK